MRNKKTFDRLKSLGEVLAIFAIDLVSILLYISKKCTDNGVSIYRINKISTTTM